MVKKLPKQTAVMWIVKKGFYLYVTGSPSLLSMGFPPDAVKYFDIVDAVKFQTYFENFLQKNKFPPFRLFIVFGADALAEKEIKAIAVKDKSDEEKSFVDMVPYENVFSKIYLSEKNRIAVVNADIFRNLKTVVEKNEGTIDSVIPYFVTGQTTPSRDTLLALSKKPELFKKENMIDQETSPQPNSFIMPPPKDKSIKSQLPLLLGIFTFFILILVVVIMTQPKTAPETVRQRPSISPSQAVSISPTIFLSVTPVASESSAPKNNLTVSVVNGSGVAGQENSLKQLLVGLGYSKIVTTIAPSAVQNSQIIFKSTVPGSLREELLNQIRKIVPSPSVQENDTSTVDILITTGR